MEKRGGEGPTPSALAARKKDPGPVRLRVEMLEKRRLNACKNSWGRGKKGVQDYFSGLGPREKKRGGRS